MKKWNLLWLQLIDFCWQGIFYPFFTAQEHIARAATKPLGTNKYIKFKTKIGLISSLYNFVIKLFLFNETVDSFDYYPTKHNILCKILHTLKTLNTISTIPCFRHHNLNAMHGHDFQN